MQSHWNKVYSTKEATDVSWYRPHLERSLSLIQSVAPDRCVRIIDVGGGASTLVDDLLQLGYRNITVLDISEAAISLTKARLREASQHITWVCGDVTTIELDVAAFDVWHDRAVFHFLTSPDARRRYVHRTTTALRPTGHAIVSTFGANGPTKCSGLPAMRYRASELHQEFGGGFRLVDSSEERHQTPFGATQEFLYCHFQLESERQTDNP